MKYCSKPFDFMWVTRTFDEQEKSMCLPCSWLTIVGNDDTDIVKHSVDEIWNGETFEKVRESIRDGSFRYCNCLSCPFISNDTLEDLPEEEFAKKTVPLEAPIHFGLAYDRTCNHACPSCRHEIYRCSSEVREENDLIGEKLLPYLNKATYIDSNGQGDFFASRSNMNLFSKLTPQKDKVLISIETNGTLFDPVHWEKIAHLRKYKIKVNITPNSYDRKTYAYLNGGFDLLDRLDENLMFVKSLREKGDINSVSLVIVVQESNVKEVPEFIKKSIEVYNADEVTIRPIYKWNFLTEEEFWFKNVANPLHPYHRYYAELRNLEIMKHPKVYDWGVMNEEPPKQHPAFRYKDIANKLADFLKIDQIEEKINYYFNKQGISEIILYGNDTLGKAIESILRKSQIEVKIKEVLCKEKIMGYQFREEDTILITNYHFAGSIRRDLDFLGYEGRIIMVDDWLNELEKLDNDKY